MKPNITANSALLKDMNLKKITKFIAMSKKSTGKEQRSCFE